MKEDILSINTLALNNCLCNRNVFQNGVNTQKAQNSPACDPSIYQMMYGVTLDFQCQRREWSHEIGKSIVPVNLPLKLLLLQMLTLEVKILSIHYLIRI